MTNRTMGQLKGVLTGKTRDNSSIIKNKNCNRLQHNFLAVATIRLHGTPKNHSIMMGHAMSPRIREEFSGPQLRFQPVGQVGYIEHVCPDPTR